MAQHNPKPCQQSWSQNPSAWQNVGTFRRRETPPVSCPAVLEGQLQAQCGIPDPATPHTLLSPPGHHQGMSLPENPHHELSRGQLSCPEPGRPRNSRPNIQERNYTQPQTFQTNQSWSSAHSPLQVAAAAQGSFSHPSWTVPPCCPLRQTPGRGDRGCFYLSTSGLVLQVVGGADFGLDVFQVGHGRGGRRDAGLGRGRRFRGGTNHCHLLGLPGWWGGQRGGAGTAAWSPGGAGTAVTASVSGLGLLTCSSHTAQSPGQPLALLPLGGCSASPQSPPKQPSAGGGRWLRFLLLRFEGKSVICLEAMFPNSAEGRWSLSTAWIIINSPPERGVVNYRQKTLRTTFLSEIWKRFRKIIFL